MADNLTRIILSAIDQTGPAFASANAGLKSMKDRADLANQALSAIGVTFSGAAAVALVKGTIDAADGFNDLAQKVGMNIRELAGWTLAANQGGASMEAMAKGIKNMSVYMVEHREKLNAAGITAKDVNGAMLQFADLLKAVPDPVQRVALAEQVLKKSGQELLPVLMQGSAGLKDAQEKADAYGKKMEELAPQADEFNDLVEELGLNAKAAGINITSYFMPGLIGLAQWLSAVAKGGEKAEEAMAWMVGERNVRDSLTMRALLGIGSDPSKRSSSGKIGGQKPVPLTLAEEIALGEKNIQGMSAAGLLDDAGSKAQTPLQRMLAEQAKRLAAMNSGYDEPTASVDTVMRQYETADTARAEAMARRHEERMEQQRIELEGEGAIQDWIDSNNRKMEEQNDIAKDLGMTFSSAFEDAIIGGKKLADVLQGLAQDVARIFLRKTVTEPLGNMAAKFFENFNPFGLKPNAAGGVYSGPGISAYSGQVVSSPTVFPFASGIGLMGEAGPEAILPLSRGADGKLGVSGGGVNVTIINNSRAQITQKESSANGKRELVVMIEDVVAGLMGSGALDSSMRQNFGAGRVGVLRG